ncbi:MAG: triose-phosphate isomerase [Alphaproteobacteria bacterium]|nr:triose-phosphate isomerase [Alphaproteobacteria bacterium]
MVAGNWKMNGLLGSAKELKAMGAFKAKARLRCDVLICPPATLIAPLAKPAAAAGIALGGQDCHPEDKGAFTGDISAPMLKDAGATAVILGHSERRTLHGERDELVRAKAEAAYRAGLIAIICVGETQEERKTGWTLDVIERQLKGSLADAATAQNTLIAYEPVWAIGTGLTPTLDDISEVHAAIRKSLVQRFGEAAAAIRILYGGSVKPANAAEILKVPGVDGALVGGASLKASDLNEILNVYRS